MKMTFDRVAIAMAIVLAVTADEFDDHFYQWFVIVSHQTECKCELAIDIDDFQQNCPGTRLVACPLVMSKRSQHWRWDGEMLRSRINGLVMDLDKLPGRNIILAQASYAETQQFVTYEKDNHIYTHFGKFERPKVIDLHLRKDTLVGTNITVYQLHLANIANQLWDIRHVK